MLWIGKFVFQNLNGSIPTGDTPPVRAISPKLVYAALTATATTSR